MTVYNVYLSSLCCGCSRLHQPPSVRESLCSPPTPPPHAHPSQPRPPSSLSPHPHTPYPHSSHPRSSLYSRASSDCLLPSCSNVCNPRAAGRTLLYTCSSRGSPFSNVCCRPTANATEVCLVLTVTATSQSSLLFATIWRQFSRPWPRR